MIQIIQPRLNPELETAGQLRQLDFFLPLSTNSLLVQCILGERFHEHRLLLYH